jgi:3-deoxy-D-manno-octulosonic-acid transferase
LAPRHPERFDAVARILTQAGGMVWRRSQLRGDEELRSGVLLLDSLGELGSIYSIADVAFVGGSMVARGGHNILEPASYGKAIVVGPHTENFRDIVELFRQNKAVVIANDEAELAHAFQMLLRDLKERRELGTRAAALVGQNAGATARTLKCVAELLNAAGERERAAR